MNRDIIRALEAGDPRSLEWIFEAYGHDCIQRLQRYENCSPEDAEDIFMESLMLFWHHVQHDRVRDLSRSRAYVYSLCVHEQRRRYRQQQRTHEAQAEVRDQWYEQPYELPLTEQNDRHADRAELSGTVQEALSRLGDRCQQVIRYFYIQKLPLAEVARRLGVADAGVAKTMRYRCHQRWLKELRKIKGTKD